MKTLLHKFTQKQFVQNVIIEVVADLLMIVTAIIVTYYIRTMLF